MKLSLADRWSVALQSWRQMAEMFLSVGALGLALSVTFVKPVHEARVVLAAPQAASAFYGQNGSARDQIGVLRSDVLARDVVGRLGARRMFPGLDARGEKGRAAALSAFRRSLDVKLSKSGDAIDVKFRAHDPRIAALALDKIISAYDAYQRGAGGLVDEAPLASQRRALDDRMIVAERAMRAFLKAHNVTDYPGALASASALADALAHDVAVGKAELAELDARLQSTADVAERTRLTVDMTARTKKVAALQLEMTAAAAKANRLRALSPEYERLRFARDMVSAAAARLSAKDEDAGAVDSVRLSGVAAFRPVGAPIVKRADVYRLPLAIAGALAAALMAALAAGLSRSLRPGMLPTPDAAERHLGLPVLVVTPRKPR